MKKYDKIVLDTNVLIHDPKVIFDFKNSECPSVVIPSIVLSELDNLKSESGEKGRNAREAIRTIKEVLDKGSINCKQKLEIVYLRKDDKYIKEHYGLNTIIADDKILCTLEEMGGKVLFLTLDNVMYIKAKTLFVPVLSSEKLSVDVELFDITKTTKHNENDYSGRTTLYAPEEIFTQMFEKGYVPIENITVESDDGYSVVRKEDLVVNQFVTLFNAVSPQSSVLGFFDGKTIRRLQYSNCHPSDVIAKNAGQLFLQEALMSPVDDAPLVICKGPAGTAKTFLSLAVAIEKMIGRNPGEFRKVLCCRPNVQMDEDLGYLPGDEKEKIAPYFRPIMDNLENFIGDDKVEDLIAQAKINFEAVAFMRGRSIVNTFLIVDEAQNLTITQVKGIITRAGRGTKVVLIGDPDQIDNPYLDKYNNGLSYASSKMKGSPLCWQLTMTNKEGVRSKLATEAAKKL